MAQCRDQFHSMDINAIAVDKEATLGVASNGVVLTAEGIIDYFLEQAEERQVTCDVMLLWG